MHLFSLTRRAVARVVLGVAVVGMTAGTAVPAHASNWYIATWAGSGHVLTNVANQTVEGFSDSSVVGQVTNFQTNDSFFSCLNGSTLNVFTAPAEFPGSLVVHNGLQGPQCTYGTWIIGSALFYQAGWINSTRVLALKNNATVEGYLDATRLPLQATNFQTNDPRYTCLNGSSINVFVAPVEYGTNYVVHNGLQGPQCTYVTLTFPIP